MLPDTWHVICATAAVDNICLSLLILLHPKRRCTYTSENILRERKLPNHRNKQCSTEKKKIHELSNANTGIVTKHNVHNYLVSPKWNGFLKSSSLIKFIRLFIFSHETVLIIQFYIFSMTILYFYTSLYIHSSANISNASLRARHYILFFLFTTVGFYEKVRPSLYEKIFSSLKEKASHEISQTMKWKFELPHQNLQLQRQHSWSGFLKSYISKSKNLCGAFQWPT